MRLRWCVLATALVLVVTACGGGSSKSGSSDTGSGGLGGGGDQLVDADHDRRELHTSAEEHRGRGHPQDDHRHGHRRREQRHPARPVQGFVGRHEGLGRLHQLDRRPRVPQGRGQRGRLQAEPDRRRRTRSRPRAATRSRLVGTTALFLQDVTADEQRARTRPAGRRVCPTSPSCRPRPRSSARRSRSRRCRPVRRAPTAVRARARSTSATRSTTTTSRSTAPTALHGVFVIPKDLPSTIASTMPIFRAENQMGIKSDAEFGESGTAIQTDYTQVAQALKSHNSTYARNGARLQGHRPRCARKRRSRA